LPAPGGPHRMNEKSCFFSIATDNGLPGPVKCSWPTNSSSVRGRIFDANGSIFFSILSDCAYPQLRYFPDAVLFLNMSTKSIVIWIVVIIIVVIGGYFAFTFMKGSTPAQSQQTQTATSTTDQVQGQDVTVGTGATATPGSTVSVLYVGYLGQISTSTVFDSSAAHGNQPLSFTLNGQVLISGFQIGVNGMKVGGERLIAVPPSLGYGVQDVKDSTGKVVIPANSTLIFDIKLVNVQPATSTAATSATTK